MASKGPLPRVLSRLQRIRWQIFIHVMLPIEVPIHPFCIADRLLPASPATPYDHLSTSYLQSVGAHCADKTRRYCMLTCICLPHISMMTSSSGETQSSAHAQFNFLSLDEITPNGTIIQQALLQNGKCMVLHPEATVGLCHYLIKFLSKEVGKRTLI